MGTPSGAVNPQPHELNPFSVAMRSALANGCRARAKFARAYFRAAISLMLKAERDPQSKIQKGVFMAQTIEINNGRGSVIGSVIFDENPVRLQVFHRANGFYLQLPITISLNLVSRRHPIPMVSDFRGTIFAGPPNRQIEVGRMLWNSSFSGGYGDEQQPGGSSSTCAHMTWLGSFADLAFYEKLRDGGSVQFVIQFEGDLCYLYSKPESYHMLRTEPHRFRPNTGVVTLTYPKEIWVNMLRELGVAENVLVEVPLPGHRSPDWDGVWEGLRNARDAFEQGGSTGWKNCIMGVRLALERWQKIEKEDMGPGWHAPTLQEREARTKKQRFDNLRWHLYQAAHRGAHTGADEWSRDDAVLLLSTLSALLAERKP
jgi:hypothetical protein